MASSILTTSLLNATRRRCPRCGRTQSVSVFAAQQTVTCRRCGTQIPPPPPQTTGDRDKPRR